MAQPKITEDQLDGVIKEGKHTIWVPGHAMFPNTANSPDFEPAVDVGGLTDFDVWEFDDTVDQFLRFFIQMPASWDGGNLVVQYVWEIDSASGAVVWRTGCSSATNGEDFSTLSYTSLTSTTSGADKINISGESTITPSGSPSGEHLMFFEMGRHATSGSDTIASKAVLVGMKIHYTVDEGNDD